MPDMPGLVARPRFLHLHDDYLNDSTENRRRFALALLSGETIADTYRRLGIGRAADWRHLEREFYAEDGPLAYWPYNRYGYLGNKHEILRQGALEAIRVVEGLPASKMTRAHFRKPCTPQPVERRLETWWICSGYGLEVDVLDGDTQVTALILTPSMPVLPDSRKPKLEKDGVIWTVAHKNVLTRYRGEYRTDQTRYPDIQDPYPVTRAPKVARELGRINKFDE